MVYSAFVGRRPYWLIRMLSLYIHNPSRYSSHCCVEESLLTLLRLPQAITIDLYNTTNARPFLASCRKRFLMRLEPRILPRLHRTYKLVSDCHNED
jgi:hypothetical protein